MPLLKSNKDTITNTKSVSSSSDKNSHFSGRRSASSSSEGSRHISAGSSRRRWGIFGRKLKETSSTRRRLDQDPSIINARQKVSDAEAAEKEADRALMEARNHVKLARKHIRTLEEEALEDTHIAKLKQAEAKVIHKTAKRLGRHGG